MILRTTTNPTTPCADCGSRYGAPYKPGNPTPARTRSLCTTCYEYHRQRGTLAQFGKLGEVRRRPARHAGKLRHPGERRAEQRQRIANRVARHEQVGKLPVPPVIEGDDFDHMQRRDNALHTSRAWLRDRPIHTAEWDDLDLCHFPDSAQTDAA